jgi:hypothetical protein
MGGDFAPLPPDLSRESADLLEALAKWDKSFADMYVGARLVLENRGNPDRIAQSAHAIRELIEKLATRIASVPAAEGESLKQKTRVLANDWRKCRATTDALKDGVWVGALDEALRNFLDGVGVFVEWFDRHKPPRRVEAEEALKKLHEADQVLPEPLFRANVSTWMSFQGYFQSVAHHGRVPVENDYVEQLARLEAFLLPQLRPRVFADFEVLDQLIAEGERRADG